MGLWGALVVAKGILLVFNSVFCFNMDVDVMHSSWGFLFFFHHFLVDYVFVSSVQLLVPRLAAIDGAGGRKHFIGRR